MTQEEKEFTTWILSSLFIIFIIAELIAHGYGVRWCISTAAILIAFLMSASALAKCLFVIGRKLQHLYKDAGKYVLADRQSLANQAAKLDAAAQQFQQSTGILLSGKVNTLRLFNTSDLRLPAE